jgi:hypothetical protein
MAPPRRTDALRDLARLITQPDPVSMELLTGTVNTWDPVNGYTIAIRGTVQDVFAQLSSSGALAPGQVVAAIRYKTSVLVLGAVNPWSTTLAGTIVVSDTEPGTGEMSLRARDLRAARAGRAADPDDVLAAPPPNTYWFNPADDFQLSWFDGAAWTVLAFGPAALQDGIVLPGVTDGTIAEPEQVLFYPATGQLGLSLAAAAGDDTFGNPVPTGLAAAPIAPLTIAATTGDSLTSETVLAYFTIAAGEFTAPAKYAFTVHGLLGFPAGQAITVQVRLGATPDTTGQVILGSFATTTTTAAGRLLAISAVLHIDAAGADAAGTAHGQIHEAASSTSQPAGGLAASHPAGAGWGTAYGGAAVDAAAPLYVTVTATYATTSASNTAVVTSGSFERASYGPAIT